MWNFNYIFFLSSSDHEVPISLQYSFKPHESFFEHGTISKMFDGARGLRNMRYVNDSSSLALRKDGSLIEAKQWYDEFKTTTWIRNMIFKDIFPLQFSLFYKKKKFFLPSELQVFFSSIVLKYLLIFSTI